MRTLRFLAPVLLSFLTLAVFSTKAQTTFSPDLTNDTGVKPWEKYDGADEKVNIGGGNLSITIPLVDLPGRDGQDLKLALTYNSQHWSPVGTAGTKGVGINWQTQQANIPSPGWQINIPILYSTAVNIPPTGTPPTQVGYWAGFVLVMGDGSAYTFSNVKISGFQNQYPGTDPGWVESALPSIDIPFATDDQNVGILLDAWRGVVTMRDGSQIWFPVPHNLWANAFNSGTEALQATALVDTNGNVINFTGSQTALGISDNLNRSVAFNNTNTTIQYKNSNGTSETITLNYAGFGTAPPATFTQPVKGGDVSSVSVSPITGVLTSIVLPNGLTYTFQYNQYAEITKITYPSGGYTRYSYAPFERTYEYPGPTSPDQYGATADQREVVAKYVCRAAVTPAGATSPGYVTDPAPNTCSVAEDETTYSPTMNASWSQNSSSTVVDPMGNRKMYTFTLFGGALQTTTVETVSSSSVPLQTVTEQYTQNQLTKRDIALPNGLVAETQWDYDTSSHWDQETVEDRSYNLTTNIVVAPHNMTERREYTYGQGGPGALLRRTDYTWLVTNPINSVDYTTPLIHIYDRKTQETIYNGAGTQVSQTTYEYDNYQGGISASGAVDHGYSYPLQWYGLPAYSNSYSSSYTTRGNLTATTRWRNTPSGSLVARNQKFDDAGNILVAQDPLGHSTTYSFGDVWGNGACAPSGGEAYPTSVTNALSQPVYLTYNSCTGTVATVTDLNGVVTTLSYDIMDRRVKAALADGAYQCLQYSDAKNTVCQSSSASAVPVTIIATQPITSSLLKTTTTILDGLSRVVQTQVNSVTPPTFTDTTYDANGNISSVSNPHTSTSQGTDGVTTYVHDALGRVTLQIPQDGTALTNNVATVYDDIERSPSGLTNCTVTTVTDEAGKSRSFCADSLARLVEVDEAPTTTALTPTAATGTGTTSGTEQSTQTGGTSAKGTITFTGSEESVPAPGCTQSCPLVYDNGTFTVKINSTQIATYTYGQNDTPSTLAANIAASLNSASPVYATAAASGQVITLTSKVGGASSDYPMSVTFTKGTNGSLFPSPSFTATPSGSTLTGGSGTPVTTYDTGSVWLTINGVQTSVSYGQTSTAATLASALVTALNSGSLVHASASGDVVTVTTTATGYPADYSFASGSSSSQPTVFTSPSFAVAVSGSSLTGGGDNSGTDSSANVTLYTYDVLGNLTCVEQHGGVTSTGCSSPTTSDPTSLWRVRRFTYNSVSDLLTTTNPEMGSQTQSEGFIFTHDNDGNVITRTDARGFVTTYGYDALNRVTSKSYSNGDHIITYGYDGNLPSGCTPTLSAAYPKGHRTGMCDAGGWEAWSYNPTGFVTDDRRSTNSVIKDTVYAPNLDDSIASITYPSSATVTYQPDGASRPVSALDSANSHTYATAVTYTPNGDLSYMQNGQLTHSTILYNQRLQPCWIYVTTGSALATTTSCTASESTPASFLDLNLAYSTGTANNGNVTGIINHRDTTRSQTFAYDGLNRISSAASSTYATSHANCFGESYNLDPWSNLLSIGVISSSYNGCIQEAPSLPVTVKNQVTTFCYDLSGNLVAASQAPCPTTYSYNAENLISADVPANITYLYDGDGKRIEKSNGILYWYGGGTTVLDETDLTGSTTSSTFAEYIFFNGRRIAKRDPSNDVFFMFSDHLGSTRAVAEVLVGGGSPTLCFDADYYPYGGEHSAIVDSCEPRYKFTGKERDTESGLDYFTARFYASSNARFTGTDPALNNTASQDPQNLSLYSYVRNRPLNSLEPDGKSVVHLGGDVFATALSLSSTPPLADPTMLGSNAAQLFSGAVTSRQLANPIARTGGARITDTLVNEMDLPPTGSVFNFAESFNSLAPTPKALAMSFTKGIFPPPAPNWWFKSAQRELEYVVLSDFGPVTSADEQAINRKIADEAQSYSDANEMWGLHVTDHLEDGTAAECALGVMAACPIRSLIDLEIDR